MFFSNIEIEKNKNTWLFGEPPIEDSKAANLLIERAVAAINEKIQYVLKLFYIKKIKKFFIFF